MPGPQNSTQSKFCLQRLLAPRSVAVIGASEKPSIGRTVIEGLSLLGFDGAIYPINPKYDSVLGKPCYSSLSAIDGTVDLVVLAVGASRVLEQLQTAARLGAGGAVIYGGGFAEVGEEGLALQRKITEVCTDAGIALCGPNCMGFFSPYAKTHGYMMDLLDVGAVKGNVGFVSQSGSVTIAMVSDVSRYGFSHIISSGNEAVVCTADYMDYLIDDSYTDVIALFTETVREPERFVAALDKADRAGKPVVMLKTGQSERAASVVQTHTGGLAGTARILSAVLKAHRAIEVSNMEELAEVLTVCQGKRWPKGRKLGFVTASGGHAELILDLAAVKNAEVPPLPSTLRQKLEDDLGHLPGDGNPVDAWGNGDQNNLKIGLERLSSSGVVDAACLTVDAGNQEPMGYRSQADPLFYPKMVAEVSSKAKIPLYLLATRHGLKSDSYVRELKRSGLVNLTGIEPAIFALDSVARFNEPTLPLRIPPADLKKSLASEIDRSSIHEFDAKKLLARAGVPTTRETKVITLEDAKAAANEIGFPVVLKVISDELPHRTDLGLVMVGIESHETLQAAWSHIEKALESANLTEQVSEYLVQEMLPNGVEVLAGIKWESGYGLQLVVGVGGVFTEVLDDVAIRCIPLREGDVETMIAETKLDELLSGIRGAPASDRKALCQALYALSDFAMVNERYISGVDVNPLIVYPQGQGCRAVDALIIPRN